MIAAKNVSEVSESTFRVLALVSNNNRLLKHYHWSPDGSQIAYIANQQTDMLLELFIRNSDGTGKTKVSSGLSNSKALDFNWSTDNTRLAFNEGP
ncbi:hypothetical protein MNBD_GAMMA25-1965, partial [hydrothermal vent metagenome]